MLFIKKTEDNSSPFFIRTNMQKMDDNKIRSFIPRKS